MSEPLRGTESERALLASIALQLTWRRDGQSSTSGPDESWLGMATRIGERAAVTTYRVAGKHVQNTDLFLRSVAWPHNVASRARLVQALPEEDLVVLQLENPPPLGDGSILPERGGFDPNEGWISWFASPQTPGGEFVSGAAAGSETIGGAMRWRLSVEEGPRSLAGIDGAPVVGAGGRLFGIVAQEAPASKARRKEASVHAIPLDADKLSRLRLAAETQVRESRQSSAPRADRPIDEAAVFRRLRSSARLALSHADGMRRARARTGDPAVLRRSPGSKASFTQDRIHMEHLIMGLYLAKDGPTDQLFRGIGIESVDVLRERIESSVQIALPRPEEYRPTEPLTSLPPRSQHVDQALRIAVEIADRAGSAEVRSGHLLYGALSSRDCTLVQHLTPQAIWWDVARLSGEEPPTGVGRFIAGFANDGPGGPDLLGIGDEAEVLSAIVVARDVKPPLSIGLFGDWGSGKSFFMKEMEKRVNRLALEAQASDVSSPFCTDVVQLWFNAWHYSDRNLWATLGAEIFEGLSQALGQQRRGAEQRDEFEIERTRILALRNAAQTAVDAAREEVSTAQSRLVESEQLAADLKRIPDENLDAQLRIHSLLAVAQRFATEQPEIREQLNRAAKELHWAELNAAGVDLGRALRDLVAVTSTARGIWVSIRRQRFAVLMLIVVLLGAAAVFGIPWILERFQPELSDLVTRVVGLLTVLTPPLLTLGRRARKAASFVSKARDLLAVEISRVSDGKRATVEMHRQAVEQAKETLAEAVQKVAALNDQLDGLRPDRRLADFIRARNASGDYTKHFGIIARARQDFEELCRLLELVDRQARTETPPEQQLSFPRIERIVLYIDDLDRCPEDKVFQVLQAVHLLLAYPLFVVVVGVDPRWLLHSLRHELGAFQESDDGGEEDDEVWVHWRSTPLNYLEKIFQIPFALRPMGTEGFARLIDDLVEATGSQQPDPATDVPLPLPGREGDGGPGARESARRTVQGSEEGPGVEQTTTKPPASEAQNEPTPPPEPESPRITHTYSHLQIGTPEREYMKRLQPLIPSPRAAKRFVNVYRILRATVNEGTRRSLVGEGDSGEHREALLLLGMLVGFPAETTELLRFLLTGEWVGNRPWWEIVEFFEQRLATGDAGPVARRDEAPSVTTRTGREPDVRPPDAHPSGLAATDARWQEFFDTLRVVRAKIGDDLDRARIMRWVVLASRFSFASGRLFAVSGSGGRIRVPASDRKASERRRSE